MRSRPGRQPKKPSFDGGWPEPSPEILGTRRKPPTGGPSGLCSNMGGKSKTAKMKKHKIVETRPEDARLVCDLQNAQVGLRRLGGGREAELADAIKAAIPGIAARVGIRWLQNPERKYER